MMYKTKAPRTSVHYSGERFYLLRLCRSALWKKYPGRYCPESENQDVTTAAMNALLQLLESGGDIDFDRRPGSY